MSGVPHRQGKRLTDWSPCAAPCDIVADKYSSGLSTAVWLHKCNIVKLEINDTTFPASSDLNNIIYPRTELDIKKWNH
jgi:hypothetical protein